MIFWTSFLVFLASIMIYILFPARTDQLSLDTYREDPLVVSFVNQHQAAKNYMDQMILWKTSGEGETIHTFSNTNLAKFVPKMMQTHDEIAYNDIGMPNPTENNSEFASGMVCLNTSKNLDECDGTNNSYIITYGYVPGWWDTNNMRRQGAWEGEDEDRNRVIVLETLWLKPMLRRTHGTSLCGRLLLPTDSVTQNPTRAYTVNNGQQYGGFETKRVGNKNYKTIPNSIGTKLVQLLPQGTISGEEGGIPILVCITPYHNPYADGVVFHWDTSNNSGMGAESGHINELGDPLVGSFDETKIIQCGGTEACSLTEYTISGTVRGNSGNSRVSLISLDEENSVNVSCDVDCILSIGNTIEDGISWTGIPKGKPFSFTYERNENGQKLNVSYEVCENKSLSCGESNCPSIKVCKLPAIRWENTNIPGPALSNVRFDANTLVDVLIYNTELSDKDVAKNNKANQKRFGI